MSAALWEYEAAVHAAGDRPWWRIWVPKNVTYGTIAAPSSQDALQRLSAIKGIVVTGVRPLTPLAGFWRRMLFHTRVPQDAVTEFLRNFATMTDSGNVTQTDACETLAQMERHPYMSMVIGAIGAQLTGSTSFAEACALFPDVFDTYVLAMIRSGSGTDLNAALSDLNDELQAKEEIAQKKSAYQREVRGTNGALGIALLAFVVILVPVIASNDTGADGPFPWLSWIVAPMIVLSDALRTPAFDILLLLLACAAFVAFRVAMLFPRYEYIRDDFALRRGEYGRILALQSQTEAFRAYGRLFDLGVSPYEAWTEAAPTASNLVYEDAFLAVRDTVERGHVKLYEALQVVKIIDPRAIAMIRAAEPEGPDVLAARLRSIATSFRRETKERIDRLIVSHTNRSNRLATVVIVVLSIVSMAMYVNSITSAGSQPTAQLSTKGTGQP